MAQTKPRSSEGESRALPRPPARRPWIALADHAHAVDHASPARELQHALGQAIAAEQPDRLSPRAALRLMLGLSAAFWALVGGGIYVLLR